MSSKELSAFGEAMRLARIAGPRLAAILTWDQIRDQLDGWTGGELDCWQLDRATDAAFEARNKALEAQRKE
jgi:hypothetical protein